jgi:hypothetical protein
MNHERKLRQILKSLEKLHKQDTIGIEVIIKQTNFLYGTNIKTQFSHIYTERSLVF